MISADGVVRMAEDVVGIRKLVGEMSSQIYDLHIHHDAAVADLIDGDHAEFELNITLRDICIDAYEELSRAITALEAATDELWQYDYVLSGNKGENHEQAT